MPLFVVRVWGTERKQGGMLMWGCVRRGVNRCGHCLLFSLARLVRAEAKDEGRKGSCGRYE
jgi:hypothetical protein